MVQYYAIVTENSMYVLREEKNVWKLLTSGGDFFVTGVARDDLKKVASSSITIYGNRIVAATQLIGNYVYYSDRNEAVPSSKHGRTSRVLIVHNCK